jgi:hypothetical protein
MKEACSVVWLGAATAPTSRAARLLGSVPRIWRLHLEARLTSLFRDAHRTIEQIIAMMCALTYGMPYPHARHDAEARTPGASSFNHNTHSLRCIHHMLANHSKRAAFSEIFLAVQYRFAAPQWLSPQK